MTILRLLTLTAISGILAFQPVQAQTAKEPPVSKAEIEVYSLGSGAYIGCMTTIVAVTEALDAVDQLGGANFLNEADKLCRSSVQQVLKGINGREGFTQRVGIALENRMQGAKAAIEQSRAKQSNNLFEGTRL